MPSYPKHSDRFFSFLCAASLLYLPLGCERSDTPTSTPTTSTSSLRFQKQTPNNIHVVTRESISTRVLASAVLRPTDVIVIRNNINAHFPPPLVEMGYKDEPLRLVYLIQEGTRVKKGDLLYEAASLNLDVWVNRKQYLLESVDYELTRWQSIASVAKLQGQANMTSALQGEQFARFDLDQYLNGTGPMIQQARRDAVTRTAARLEQSQHELIQSEKLYANGYISKADLESDRLLQEERRLANVNAISQRILFEQYRHPRQVLEFERDIAMRQSDYNLSKISAMNQNMNAQRWVTYNQLKSILRTKRLAQSKQDLIDAKMHAPADGVVIYPHSNGIRRSYDLPPIEEGSTIYRGDQIVHIISSNRMHAETLIMSTDLYNVQLGQPVQITTQDLPDRVILGHVENIKYMATQASAFKNPDLLQYRVLINIDSDTTHLKPGMNAQAEILIDHVDHAIVIPIEAITTLTDHKTGQTSHAVALTQNTGENHNTPTNLTPVTLGIRSAFKVQVLTGLNPGDHVKLNP